MQLFVAVTDGCGGSRGDSSGESTLYDTNPANAQSTQIGTIGFLGVTALEFLGDGRLVGSARDDLNGTKRATLIEINPATGAGSGIGLIGVSDDVTSCGRAPGLTYDATTDTLFATGFNCQLSVGFLQSINQATGNGTLIGSTAPYAGAGYGIAIRDDGVIFVTSALQGTGHLFTVDPSNGDPTFVGNTGVDNPERINALAFHPNTGELYGTTVHPGLETSTLVTLNTTTGLASEVGDLPNCADGLAFKPLPPPAVPTLSEWGLIAMAGVLGIVGFMAIRRRKVAA
jgi:hypothetical protein